MLECLKAKQNTFSGQRWHMLLILALRRRGRRITVNSKPAWSTRVSSRTGSRATEKPCLEKPEIIIIIKKILFKGFALPTPSADCHIYMCHYRGTECQRTVPVSRRAVHQPYHGVSWLRHLLQQCTERRCTQCSAVSKDNSRKEVGAGG